MRISTGVLLSLLLTGCAASPPPGAPASPPPPPAAPAPPADAQPLPQGDAAAEGVDPAALARLVDRAKKAGSDGLVIVKNGKVLYDLDPAREPIETMSVTKSIVNLAIGMLVDSGKIRSLDEPVHTYYPEWNQGKKKRITIRHLLNHTSGLQSERTTPEIYASPDFVQLALAAELVGEPGSAFFYNNKATNLLAGIVQRASGERMDRYLEKALFAPLGITRYGWTLDKANNPHGMSGLQLRPVDLAKIGVMLADGGTWKGQRLVSNTWIAESTRAGQAFNPSCGLLWWIMPESMRFVIDDSVIADWRKAGQSEDFIKRVSPMKDRVLDKDGFFGELEKVFNGPRGIEEWHEATWRRGLADGKAVPGPTIGFYADGWLGQYLVVIPQAKLVAVRMRASNEDKDAKAEKEKGFSDFRELVRDLAGIGKKG
jgi:CubicO group peptidase (beta-lactamase class C family)